MRTPTRLIFTLATTLACTLAACGGEGGGPVDSGLPPEKTGMELTADEADRLCTANLENLSSQNTAGEQKNATCVALGLLFTAQAGNTPAECESVAKMCRDGAGEDGMMEGGEQMCELGFELMTCTATIADIEACMTEKNEASAEAIRNISCDDAGKDPIAPVTGPSCTKIKSTCPGIA